jgi:hypothetical protein
LLLLDVTAELESHGGEQLVSEVFFASRCELLLKRGAQDRSGSPFVDGGGHSPAALPRVGHSTRELGEIGLPE